MSRDGFVPIGSILRCSEQPRPQPRMVWSEVNSAQLEKPYSSLTHHTLWLLAQQLCVPLGAGGHLMAGGGG